MKRQKKRVFIRNFDPNRERVYKAGQAARDAGKPVSACPSLLGKFASEYAIALMDRWLAGWNDRDRELRAPELPFGARHGQ